MEVPCAVHRDPHREKWPWNRMEVMVKAREIIRVSVSPHLILHGGKAWVSLRYTHKQLDLAQVSYFQAQPGN